MACSLSSRHRKWNKACSITSISAGPYGPAGHIHVIIPISTMITDTKTDRQMDWQTTDGVTLPNLNSSCFAKALRQVHVKVIFSEAWSFNTFCTSKDVGHFPLTKCLYLQYGPGVPGMSPGPYILHSLKIWKVITDLWVTCHLYYNLTKSAPDPLIPLTCVECRM